MTATSHKPDASNFTQPAARAPLRCALDPGTALPPILGLLLGSLAASCACSPALRPDETQLGQLYGHIQVYEAQQETAATALARARAQSELGGEPSEQRDRQIREAEAALKAAADRICYTADQIRETDATLRCRTARKRAAQ